MTNIYLEESFHRIVLNWTDNHSIYDPVEFIVYCSSKTSSMVNIGRKTSHVCEQSSSNEIDLISVQTVVAIPGYIHPDIAVVHIDSIDL